MSTSSIVVDSEERIRLMSNRELKWAKFASKLRVANGSQSLLNTLIDQEYSRRLQAQNWSYYRWWYHNSDYDDFYQEDTELYG